MVPLLIAMDHCHRLNIVGARLKDDGMWMLPWYVYVSAGTFVWDDSTYLQQKYTTQK
jgi:hypothetical protein